MDESSCASLDKLCPYPIDCSLYEKPITLRELKNDSARISAEVVKLRIQDHLSENLEREIMNIFKILPSQSENPTEIVDKYLLTHLKIVKLRLKDEDETTNVSGWNNIFGSFHLDCLNLMRYIRNDTNLDDYSTSAGDPALSWLFKNRTMMFLKYNTAILSKIPLFYPYPRRPFLCQLKLVNSKLIHIDDEDCRSIISEVIYPLLRAYEDWNTIDQECCRCYEGCSDYISSDWPNCRCCDSGECKYGFIIRSICKRHDSIFGWSIEFAMSELLEGPEDRLDQAACLLSFFLRDARNRDEWILVNNSIDKLMRSERAETRSRVNWLLSILVERNGEYLEKLSDHLDNLIEMFHDTSDEVRNQNDRAWRRIARCLVAGPKGYKAIRTMIGPYLIELDKTLELARAPTDELFADRSPATINLESALWLMMPRLKFDNLDPHSTSDQLFEDLKQFTCTEREKILGILCRKFKFIYEEFVRKSDTKDGFDLALNRASWLLIKQISSRQLNMLKDLQSLFTYGAGKYSLPGYLGKPDCRHYCKLVLDMYKHINDPSHQNELPQRFSRYMEAILSVGPWTRNEEKMHVAESLVVKVLTENPALDESADSFIDVFKKTRTLRLLYFLRSERNLRKLSSKYHGKLGDHTIQRVFRELDGIQSRRMVLVSLCKLLIYELASHELIPEMINQLDKLQIAYELREKQEYSCDQENLLPTCVELAFPTPFDDPESQFYACEYDYFRYTLNHLDQKGELVRIVASLDEKMRARLHYYQQGQRNIDICCSPIDPSAIDQLEFKCICLGGISKHDDGEDQGICLLLERSFWRSSTRSPSGTILDADEGDFSSLFPSSDD